MDHSAHAYPDNRRRVLDATDIVQLIGEHITLTPKGREFRCRCPFHDDHNPSMCVVPAKQIFHCFVCGSGGNAIDFVLKYHSMTFREALVFLAERAGVPLELRAAAGDQAGGSSSADGASDAGASTREELLRATSYAQEFFRVMLAHPRHGEAAREMILKRGISPEMVESFGLGAAPDRWDGLLRLLESKNLPPAPSAEAGLLKRRDPGSGSGAGYYDAFRHRLIFPIHDQIGRVIAFGARKIREEDEPKYLNSPESRLFDKGATLFGLHQASRSIQTQRHAIITEGYIDAIACHQAGFTNTVATLGTALTHKHAVALERLCSSVTLLFDGDEAGQRAADRALEVFFARSVVVRIATIPEGADPDDLLKQPGGADRFRALLAGARDLLEYRFERLRASLDRRGLGAGSVARAAAVEAEIGRLVELGLGELPPVRREVVIQNLAHVAGVGHASVLAAIQSQTKAFSRRSASLAGQAPRIEGGGSETVRVSALDMALERALGCLLLDPVLAETSPVEAREILELLAYRSPLLKEAAEMVSAALNEGRAPSYTELLLRLEEDQAVRLALTGLIARLDHITEGDHHAVARNWTDALRRVRERLAFDAEPSGGERDSRSGAGAEADAPGAGALASGADSDPALALIERLRTNHKVLGGNPLALPRPAVLSP